MKHNVYFEGKVQSLGLNAEDRYATVGVIKEGQYTFLAESEERVTIVSGQLRVKLPDEDWKVVRKNEQYIARANSSFAVETTGDVAYICYYK